ncbi:ribosome hibernation-promoting factor, HPF/YfiA family [Proteocatella sphenisci]|uniref:ribosome hibernation-promoting factor, HPF/YfiA family n=1 Tax=Proteocatella sphenisci TaxID=181070 RepID=UPI000490833E|nr:ribosome-associated translation inhibitor RaiA [Proteocatella sphenisci]
MLVNILGRNLRITEAMEANFEEKLSRLDKYFSKEQEAKVKVATFKNEQKVEITIPFENGMVRAEASDLDVYNALDLSVEKLKKQLTRHKDKLMKRAHHSIRFENIGEFSPQEDDIIIEEGQDQIIKRKSFEYRPMSEEDAILQLEMLGHEFFAFLNHETDKISVVYKRNDGYYGLIEPKV